MAKKRAASKGHQIHDPSAEGLEVAQATAAGSAFAWQYGRVTSLGSYEVPGGWGVITARKEGGASSHVGDITGCGTSRGWSRRRRSIGDVRWARDDVSRAAL